MKVWDWVVCGVDWLDRLRCSPLPGTSRSTSWCMYWVWWCTSEISFRWTTDIIFYHPYTIHMKDFRRTDADKTKRRGEIERVREHFAFCCLYGTVHPDSFCCLSVCTSDLFRLFGAEEKQDWLIHSFIHSMIDWVGLVIPGWFMTTTLTTQGTSGTWYRGTDNSKFHKRRLSTYSCFTHFVIWNLLRYIIVADWKLNYRSPFLRDNIWRWNATKQWRR